ncbi:fimbrial protein [Serratia fonticola]|jgi:type 1 fimbria pilin|uniref:fimbrial protein n=1 Tax=Serratia fonticola TaxID=47917 RepID=UPI0021785894|nr:fimbrial protein [Serratia fonticola]CAI1043682.1 Fimbria A protein precursor [Serratia fonticola]CAI1172304.1 Fimbria A protein precursor [Serratia fonticola]CAI1759355.1 Fimbria A protein precursor [Serratia fonticola]CAI2019173.1 Fimbria A protein precursor [Serratia fonticola]CAI2537929.1 Fimbria A protein precursor [Serratia fonticola]
MKLNKIMMVAVVAFGMSSLAHAAVKDQGHGKLTFNGSIIDAPCSITQESAEQTIELGQISKVALKDGGKSSAHAFTIDLENCEIGTGPDAKNKVSVSFNGNVGAVQDRLGTGRGASIVIEDAKGPIKLAKPTVLQQLQGSDNALNFSAYLQGDGASAAVTEGKFETVANFTLAYE